MPDKLVDVYRNAEAAYLKKQYEQALAGFATVLTNHPAHIWSRFQVGSVLEEMRALNRAFEVYKALAWHCIRDGQPLLGLDATKRAERIQGGFQGTLEVMADLYSLESDRIDTDKPVPQLEELHEDLEITSQVPVDAKLPAVAENLAKTFKDPRHVKHLPAVPLFSFLSLEAFYPILEMLELRTFRPGDTIVKEGEPSESFYLLAHGEVEVLEGRNGDSRTLARLPSGSVFGEMSLITNAPRVASAIALRTSDVLELHPEELLEAAEDLDDITLAMAKFTRQRFLNNLLVTSPVFAPFSPDERKEILELFTSVGVPTDDVIIQEGTPGPGLYLILGGEVEVNKFEGDSRVHLATLREGSVIGEISLVHDKPTTATVRATRGGEFLFLSRDDFQDLVRERPEIKDALTEIGAERLQEQRTAIQEAGILSEDGAVIF